MSDLPVQPGDPVTLIHKDAWLRHARVTEVGINKKGVLFIRAECEDDGRKRIVDRQHATCGITWTPGHHEENSSRIAALRAAYALAYGGLPSHR